MYNETERCTWALGMAWRCDCGKQSCAKRRRRWEKISSPFPIVAKEVSYTVPFVSAISACGVSRFALEATRDTLTILYLLLNLINAVNGDSYWWLLKEAING